MRFASFTWPLALLLTGCFSKKETELSTGMVIAESVVIKPGTYLLSGTERHEEPVIRIEGDGIVVDFNGAELRGTPDSLLPDGFAGCGILIRGKNITLKNAVVRGYKWAVMAFDTDSLQLLDCDLSYNWRPRLKSRREREDFSDWLSYHQNDNDEWLRYGAAAYLKNCHRATVRGLKVTGGMNGLLLTRCDEGLFYNNTIQFNSGVGMGLYRSSRNRILHNRLDWNVRGYSHGFYQRGQDSAALLVYEQSNDNVFAFNSATHSGDGFFLWAGNTTMDSGEGGCNGNLLFENDFSYAPTNGVEVTFSSNAIVNNTIRECTYGIWGGYSFESLIAGNHIAECRYGIAIEHGQDNDIVNNHLERDSTGVQLWERNRQPTDWGYAQNRDVSSRNYRIQGNTFSGVHVPLRIASSKNVAVSNDNVFEDYEQVLREERPNENLQRELPPAAIRDVPVVEPLSDGMHTAFPEGQLSGRQYILVDEWGPFDFGSPSAWLREVKENKYVILLLGPLEGNWKATGGEGWTKVNPLTGRFPATLIATRDPKAESLSLELQYIGQAFTDRFGRPVKRGTPYAFGFSRFEKKLSWQVGWYNCDDTTDPLNNYEAFRKLREAPPQASSQTDELYYAWWGSPAAGIEADRFATFATAVFEAEEGEYTLRLTSDDGARLYLDGVLILDNWSVHEPETSTITVRLGGKHTLLVEHFENDGFATLDFRLER